MFFVIFSVVVVFILLMDDSKVLACLLAADKAGLLMKDSHAVFISVGFNRGNLYILVLKP